MVCLVGTMVCLVVTMVCLVVTYVRYTARARPSTFLGMIWRLRFIFPHSSQSAQNLVWTREQVGWYINMLY